MVKSEGEWDEEFTRVFNKLEELTKRVQDLERELAQEAQRNLLRVPVPGIQFCRLCSISRYGVPKHPAISEWEQKFHDASHAQPLHADRSRGLPGFSGANDWSQLEKELAAYKKKP